MDFIDFVKARDSLCWLRPCEECVLFKAYGVEYQYCKEWCLDHADVAAPLIGQWAIDNGVLGGG